MEGNLMRLLLIASAAVSLVSTSPEAGMAADAGIRALRVDAPHRERPLDVTLLFLSQSDGRVAQFGANALFTGVPAREGATPEPGRHPLVLLSHGLGGNAPSLAWLGTALARAGFVVAAANHPGTTTDDSRAAEAMRLWLRQADLSRMLDVILHERPLADVVNEADISAVGFSLGGHTALASVGLRMSAVNYRIYCDTDWPDRPLVSECAWVKQGVDLRDLDARFEADLRDPRVIRAVAIDPGLAHAASAESLALVTAPVTVISLGSPDRLPPAVATDRLMALLPQAVRQFVDGANHFSALGECREDSRDILIAEQEPDPICDDSGRPRADLHAEIARLVVSGLRRPAFHPAGPPQSPY
jgi:predicted dienelactone hydrolase